MADDPQWPADARSHETQPSTLVDREPHNAAAFGAITQREVLVVARQRRAEHAKTLVAAWLRWFIRA
jgi:hypothetical protein